MPFEYTEAGSSDAQIREEIWLLGQPPLKDHLDFIRRCVAGGDAMDPRALCDAWRKANDHYYDLERREAGLAERAVARPLPAAMKPLAEALSTHSHFRCTFDALPVTFGMVELDSLIVYQPHVTRPFVERLGARLDPAPDAAGLFHFCQPMDRRDPEVKVQRLGSGRYLFTCDSNDFRYHRSTLLRPEQVSDFETFGPMSFMVGAAIGFGGNFLSVIRSDRRMLLHNGYHRACALRAAGYTHAPAVIQTVTRRDELALVAPQCVVDEPAFYFGAARPPLLKDFFDPKIRTVLPVRRMEKMIEVTIDVNEYDLPRM